MARQKGIKQNIVDALFNLFCPCPLALDCQKKSAVRKGPTGYDYPDSIQFHTALGSFSALASPAPLARIEIVFAVFDYQAAARSPAAVPQPQTAPLPQV